MLTEYNIFDFFEYINENSNYLLNCTICGDTIINTTNKIRSCNKCLNKFVKIVSDNDIIDEYNTDKFAFSFILLTSYSCLQNPHRNELFKPLPYSFNSLEEVDKEIKYVKSFSKIIEIIRLSINDNDLLSKIGLFDYTFIKFSIISNNTKLLSHVLFNSDKKNIFDNDVKFGDILNMDEIISFNVLHPLKIENKSKGIKPSFLFHGSSLSNWFSILRNGLKNMSGTKLMINGAAYGSGIYLSHDVNVSFSYGIDKHCNTGIYAIGVVQILDDKSKYFKGHYVVPNEEILILRHIILVKQKSGLNLDFINKYFISNRELEISNASESMSIVKNKRIDNELKLINKKIGELKCECKFMNNTYYINLKNFGLAITYPENYPAESPFIWIFKHNIKLKKYKSFNILKNGGIIKYELDSKNWNASIKIHEIIKIIINEIIENIDSIEDAYKLNTYDDAYNEYILFI